MIDPAVKLSADNFNIDPALIQAVVNAEGGNDAIIKAVQCTYANVTTLLAALRIVCRSACHAMSDFIVTMKFGCTDTDGDPTHTTWDCQEQFVQFWAARWAPRKVANDPTDLNANWPKNVLFHWRKLRA